MRPAEEGLKLEEGGGGGFEAIKAVEDDRDGRTGRGGGRGGGGSTCGTAQGVNGFLQGGRHREGGREG